MVVEASKQVPCGIHRLLPMTPRYPKLISPVLRRPLGHAVGLIAATSSVALAQSPTFQTPGMPNWAASGQIDRFSSDFNPAIGALVDGFGDYVMTDEDDGEGLDLFLRSFEMTVNGRIDPNWYGYAVVVYSDEEVELEEAAVTYAGFEGNTTLRFGRFFVDFGKQMQAHIHDLPYPDRPGVLAEYLGEELPGVGAQVDHWWTTGESSALRASLGIFSEFELGGHGEEGSGEPSVAQPERGDANDLGLTGRITQFMDAGKTGVFQWGASARHIGAYSAEDEASGASIEGLSTTTFGLDATYGFDSDDGLSGWTFGTEYLLATGDIGAEFDGVGASVLSGDRGGYYAWAERRVNPQNAYGLLVSSFEHLESAPTDEIQITGYYTHFFSEFARLRFAVSHADIEEAEDSTRFLVQLTTFFGPHAHGVNW